MQIWARTAATVAVCWAVAALTWAQTEAASLFGLVVVLPVCVVAIWVRR